jgi:hypothetical protein
LKQGVATPAGFRPGGEPFNRRMNMDEIGNEVMLWSWADSPAGQKVTFLLNEEGEHPFKQFISGKHGQRFQMVLVKINDDETTE